MGLCKCPKRKVTNLFCFEHRVNVCESCLVTSHESCVVQTYLSWLTDSDYDSNCILCSEQLSAKETIRLKCFHVFHWDCLNARANQLPKTTAPAGYKCPSCLDVIFPASNQVSPVIDQLREKLSRASWAVTGLNLQNTDDFFHHYANQNNDATQSQISPMSKNSSVNNSVDNSASFSVNIDSNEPRRDDHPFEGNTFTARSKLSTDSNTNNGKYALPTTRLLESDDSPDVKYARKGHERASLRVVYARLPRSVTRLLLVLFVLFLLYLVMGSSGWMSGGGHTYKSAVEDEDPMFDPHANPNIHIESKN